MKPVSIARLSLLFVLSAGVLTTGLGGFFWFEIDRTARAVQDREQQSAQREVNEAITAVIRRRTESVAVKRVAVKVSSRHPWPGDARAGSGSAARPAEAGRTSATSRTRARTRRTQGDRQIMRVFSAPGGLPQGRVGSGVTAAESGIFFAIRQRNLSSG